MHGVRGATLPQKSEVQFAGKYILDKMATDCSGASGVVIFGVSTLSYVGPPTPPLFMITTHRIVLDFTSFR